MRAFGIVTLILTMSLAFALTTRAQVREKYEGWCSTLEAANLNNLVQFLHATVPDEQNARCVTWAINKLGKERYDPAVVALVKLLDFRLPKTEADKTFRWGDEFPAEEALTLIGKRALPELLRAIEESTAPDTLREHAVFVWMEIYRQSDEHTKGVADLKQEEAKVSDAQSRARLKWAVGQAVARCNVSERAECRKAAATGSP
jgi:hypothetical protein